MQNKNFPMLYKRAKTGKIVCYQLVVKETSVDTSLILKTTGQLGTLSPIQHSEIVAKGKQGRTHYEQAINQAQSDYKKKLDEGYKALFDLNIVEFTPRKGLYNINGGTELYNLTEALNRTLSLRNTDYLGQVKPMLAHPIEKIKNVADRFPAICEPKLDGARCLIIIDFDKKISVKFLSRNGKYYSLDHIRDELEHIFLDGSGIPLSLPNIEFPIILDGEVYSEELTFQEIISAIKKPSALTRKLSINIYDIVIEDEEVSDRKFYLQKLFEWYPFECLRLLPWRVALDLEQAYEYHDEFVQQGYEGAMVRLKEGLYESGARSRNLLKVKKFDENEFIVKRLTYGQRGVEDLIAICELQTGEFGAKIQGSKAQKIALEKEFHDIINKRKPASLTVKHFGLTSDGVPRFPIGKALRTYEG